MTHTPITSAELSHLKQFWQEEDAKHGGVSDTSRCIAEIERLQAELDSRPSPLTLADVTPDETVAPFTTGYISTGFGEPGPSPDKQ